MTFVVEPIYTTYAGGVVCPLPKTGELVAEYAGIRFLADKSVSPDEVHVRVNNKLVGKIVNVGET